MASPQYELGYDADGNVVLVPAQSQTRAPVGFGQDVANKARQYFAPRPSDFTKGTKEAFGAGQELSKLGYENFSTNPLYGAGQVVAGSALSALSPISGATDFLLNPAGRTFGPPAEHAADVASMVLPTPSKGRAMLKPKPEMFRTNVKPKVYGPPEMQGPRQITPDTFIGPPEMQGPSQPFRTSVRPKTTPETFIGPPEAYGPPSPFRYAEPIGPEVPFRTNVQPKIYGPPEMQGPRQVTPQTMIGPPEMQGPMRPPAANTNDPLAALRQSIIDKSAEQVAASRAAEQTTSATQRLIEEAAKRAHPSTEAMYPNYRPQTSPSMAGPLAVGGAGALGAMAMQSAGDEAQLRNFANQYGQTESNSFTPEQEEILRNLALKKLQSVPSDYGSQYGGLPDMVPQDYGSQYGSLPDAIPADYGSQYGPLPKSTGQSAAQRASARPIPMPPSRELQAQARAEQPSGGFLSGLFTNRPASTRQLFEQSQANPDDAGAWMRAERQYAATHKDKPNFDVTQLNDQGMARGGSAGGAGGKDAALHKALEIIHHMLMQR